MKTYNVCLLGFGHVGRALLRLLVAKRPELRARYNLDWRVTGVATRRMGWVARSKGLNPAALFLNQEEATATRFPVATNISDWLAACQADVLFETTSLNPQSGQPAIDYLIAALNYSAHVITANKGPLVFAYAKLRQLAAEKNKRFLFESTVLDGAPIFSLFRETLPAANLLRFRGILNSTTNFILTDVESGSSLAEAVRRARTVGIAETDPNADIEGWDAAIKVAVLVTILMELPLELSQVQREGIRSLNEDAIRAARAEGKPFKLVCRAERQGGKVTASVRPEQVPLTDALAQTQGASSIVHFETDVLPGFTILEHNPGPETTAYGMLADFIHAAQA